MPVSFPPTLGLTARTDWDKLKSRHVQGNGKEARLAGVLKRRGGGVVRGKEKGGRRDHIRTHALGTIDNMPGSLLHAHTHTHRKINKQHAHTHMQTPAHTYMLPWANREWQERVGGAIVCTYTHAYVCSYIYVCMHMHICIFTYMYIHISDLSFKKNFCLMNIRPQDLLSHEPTLWFRRYQLFWFRRTIFLRPQTATKSLNKCR